MLTTACSGAGAGEGATAACRTGLPLGADAAGAAAGPASLAADIVLIFWRSSAFSFSILSSRRITSSSVADRAGPLNASKQRAAQAVPERSLVFMAFPQSSLPVTNFGLGNVNVYQIPIHS